MLLNKPILGTDSPITHRIRFDFGADPSFIHHSTVLILKPILTHFLNKDFGVNFKISVSSIVMTKIGVGISTLV